MKGVETIMGGEILEPEVDKILNRGIDIGKEEGKQSLKGCTNILIIDIHMVSYEDEI